VKKALFLYSEELERYAYPDECPFNSRRAGLTRQRLLSMGLLSGSDRGVVAPRALARSELERFHSPAYLDAIRRAGDGHLDVAALGMGLGTPDCPVFKGMYEYASLAAGGSVAGAECLLRDEAMAAFNPSGGYHHAWPDHASGFCYINDVVLACMTLAGAGKRVAFVDIDVHHSDGVQAAFYDRSDVLVISVHESGRTLFPGTGFEDEIGTGAGRGFTVNVPLPVGTYDAAYESVFDAVVMPLLGAYKPDCIVMEMGMDTLSGDPLAHLHLTNNVPADCLARVMRLGRPMLVTGGGGYNVENTVRGWALVWGVLCGDASDDLAMGLGGVMLANSDWVGGMRDRTLISDAGRRSLVDTEIAATVRRVKEHVFPIHGLDPGG
jgi:acetoin utilization protein AcuC